MSTSVYTGLNTFNFYSQKLPADLLVRCFLCTQLLQFLIHYACVGDHDTLQNSTTKSTYRSLSAQQLSEHVYQNYSVYVYVFVVCLMTLSLVKTA